MTLPLAVFASGSGSNLQALMDHFAGPDAVARVALVVSDRPGAGALERAASAGVPTALIEVRGRSEERVAEETLAALSRAGIELVALAGYLRLVPAAVTRHFRNRMLNIHPALLPAFGGAGMFGRRVHEAVLAAGCRVTGATVHLVDERYDEGRPVAQWPVPVLPGDTPERLAARVLAVEHRLYPAVVEALARKLTGGAVTEHQEVGEPAFVLGRLDDLGAVDVRRLLQIG